MSFRRTLSPVYQTALHYIHAGRGVSCVVNGETFRVDPRHRLASDHDAPVARFLRERIRTGDVLFNVGANVGVYALQMARWGAGKVYAFEPSPEAVKVLRRHLKMNGVESVVEVVPLAVGSSVGKATLYEDGADVMSRLEAPNPLVAERTAPVTVGVTAIDAFCAERGVRPAWVFMDIEGYEVAALRSAKQTAGAGTQFVVEMHPDIWDRSDGASRAELESILAELRLMAVPLTGQSDPLGEHGIVFLKPGLIRARRWN